MAAAAPRNRFAGLPLALAVSLLLLAASFSPWLLAWIQNPPMDSAFRAMRAAAVPGSTLGNQLAAYAGAQLLLHLGFGTACWLLARASRVAWPKNPAPLRTWVVLWLLLGTLWVLLANAAWYPQTVFGDHLYHAAQAAWGDVTVVDLASLLLGGYAVLTLATAAWRHLAGAALPARTGWTAAAGLALMAASTAFVRQAPERPAPAAGERPHVILLGLDSLRCDVTQPPGRDGLTPNIERFLAAATLFSDAMTPLARTYPSWISILTGKHPHTTGAIVNLLHRDQLDLGDTLPAALRRAGYRTVHAIDEVRFSNIDASYGFDQTITPPIGAADFLVGLVNDAPLSNVVSNTRLGRWLFPYGYANRAAARLYDPDTYVERLERELEFDRPTFLSLHLTLAHWPYTWANSPPTEIGNAENWTATHYRPAVRRVDQQFGDVLELLRRKGALDNAIVVVLSDHGEAVGLPDDSPWSAGGPADEPYAAPILTGHGTSVLSPHQYRVLLAMRAFGPAARALAPPRLVETPTSLEDVAPTLNDWLGLGMRPDFDGLSLWPLLRDASAAPSAALAGRIRFTETEFNPRGFLPGKKPTASEVATAASSYEIDPDSGRLHIRRSERAFLLRQRQYAAIRDGEIVAAIPGTFTRGFRFIHIDAAPGALPRRLEGPPDPVAAPTAAALWSALQARFGESFSGAP